MAADQSEVSMHHNVTIIAEDGTTRDLSIRYLKKESDYFSALFQSGMKETKESTIQMSAVSGHGLNVFQSFLENGELEPTTLELLFEALDTAIYLQAQGLIQLCNKAILSQLSPSNCDQMEEFYKKYYLFEKVSTVQKYRNEHIMEYSDTEDFKSLDLEKVCTLLRSSDINVPSELAVWKLILKWLKSNRAEIDQLCPSGKQDDMVPLYQRLLGVVRFPAIPLTQLKSLDKKHNGNIFSDRDGSAAVESVCREYCGDAVKYHSDPCLVHTFPTTQTEVRNPVKVMVALGGFTAKESASSVVQYADWDSNSGPVNCNTDVCDSFVLTQKNKWKLPSPLCENGVCVLNNVLYVAGGQTTYEEDGRHTSNKVYQFDPRICRWKERAPMLKKRSLFYLGSVPGTNKLFAVSGWEVLHNFNGATPTVEVYDVTENCWEFVHSLDSAMGEHTGCSLHGELYISGGFKGPFRGHLDKLWKYDEINDDWVTLAPMVNARSYHAMVAIGDNSILVAGGVSYIGNDSFEDVKTCELYNPSTNQWAVLHANLPHPASCMSFHYTDHCLYLFGGHSFEQDADHDSVMVLDCNRWEWRERKLKSRTVYFTAAVLDVPKYMM